MLLHSHWNNNCTWWRWWWCLGWWWQVGRAGGSGGGGASYKSTLENRWNWQRRSIPRNSGTTPRRWGHVVEMDHMLVDFMVLVVAAVVVAHGGTWFTSQDPGGAGYGGIGYYVPDIVTQKSWIHYNLGPQWSWWWFWFWWWWRWWCLFISEHGGWFLTYGWGNQELVVLMVVLEMVVGGTGNGPDPGTGATCLLEHWIWWWWRQNLRE